MTADDDETAIAAIRSLLCDAAERLRVAGIATEALARFVPARRVMGFTRASRLIPLGRVWRLGVFLLAADAHGAAEHFGASEHSGASANAAAGASPALYATGTTTRAVDPLRRGFQSLSAEVRRDYRDAAFRGPFRRGETVNFDARVLRLDADELRDSAGPLLLVGTTPLVRWATTIDVAPRPFEGYLAERLKLLINRGEGA